MHFLHFVNWAIEYTDVFAQINAHFVCVFHKHELCH